MKAFTKYFAIAEAAVVFLPCLVWWAVMGVNLLFPVGRLLYKLSFYFIPANLLLQSGFASVAGIIMPRSLLGWFTVIITYTVPSLAIALLAAGITHLRQRKTSQNITLEGSPVGRAH
jgi:hypothetical protein